MTSPRTLPSVHRTPSFILRVRRRPSRSASRSSRAPAGTSEFEGCRGVRGGKAEGAQGRAGSEIWNLKWRASASWRRGREARRTGADERRADERGEWGSGKGKRRGERTSFSPSFFFRWARARARAPVASNGSGGQSASRFCWRRAATMDAAASSRTGPYASSNWASETPVERASLTDKESV